MDFNFEEDEAPEQQKKGPKKRFRKNKLKLVFDIEERKQFLLGFRKRKQERKEKYIEKLERDLAKEKKRIRQQTERATKKLSNSHAVLPEVQSLIDNMPERTETYDLGKTLVSITSLDDQIHRNFPVKKEEASDSEEETQKKSAKKIPKSSFESDNDDEESKEITKNDPFFNPANDDEFSRSDLSSEEEEEVHYNPLEMLRKQQAKSDTSEVDPDQKNLTKAKLEREANRILQSSEVFKKMQRIKQKRSKKFRMFRLQPPESKDGPSTGGKGKGKKSSVSENKKGGGKKSKSKGKSAPGNKKSGRK
ncbi:Nucleolar protein 12 [Orchesella cincta]|uniref:Nucleolar protein 12 n=1 Tax=Orchesella cincta TaxID=48709 RepID=A0A1D2NE85_ORCCI|nr:Nucleolar protein 12 [Orchesella cincta]